MASPLLDLYDPRRFRALAHDAAEVLASSLERSLRSEGPVMPSGSPEQLAARFALPPAGSHTFEQLVTRVVELSIKLHHPRYVGHQVSSPLPEAAVADLVAAFLNNGMAVFEMGPAGTAMEQVVLEWMASRLGYGPSSGGALTSGGSAGTLTALLAARQARAGFDIWAHGAQGGPPLGILAGGHSHYCVQRAAQIMGLGAAGVVPVGVDGEFRMRADLLPAALEEARRRGLRVIAVVASAASTATGAYDPLPAIADFCARHELWLHVDGAHGAVAALSRRHRHLVEGIERADSVVWDAHKMMLMPALVTAVLFKDRRHSQEAFAQDASYLFRDDEHPWSDVGQRTLECTKRMLGLKLWLTLALHGEALFEQVVDHTFALGRALATRLEAAPDFELAVMPRCNIVCFRHRPPGVADDELDELQRRVRAGVVDSGEFYLVKTQLGAHTWLRTTLINPLTTEPELDHLLDTIRAAAR